MDFSAQEHSPETISMMDHSTPSNPQHGNEDDQGEKQEAQTPTIIETCILITSPDVESQGAQYLAKRRFILSLEANGPTTSTNQPPASSSTIYTPEPPPGTKTYHQRLHELNLTTLMNEGTPLTAISALVRQNVALGIEKDILLVRIGNVEADNNLLSNGIRKFQEAEKGMKWHLTIAKEKLRACQNFMDLQRKNTETITEQSDKAQSKFRVEIYELDKANKLLQSRLDEIEKAHKLLLQQPVAQPPGAPTRSGNHNRMSSTADRVNEDLSSATGQLLICQKRLESERYGAQIARNQHVKDRMEFSQTIRDLEETNDSLTAELEKVRKAHEFLPQRAAARFSAAPLLPKNDDKMRATSNRVKMNLATATTYLECKRIAEEQDQEIIRLTSDNTILGKRLDEATRWKNFYKFGVSYNDDIVQGTKKELQKKIEAAVELTAEKTVMQGDLETQTREHAKAEEKLKKKVREGRDTVGVMAEEIRECNKIIQSLRNGTEQDRNLQLYIGIGIGVIIISHIIRSWVC